MLARLKKVCVQPEFWSVTSMMLRNFGSMLLMPLILRTIPSNQMGLWYVLLAIGGLAALTDLGLSQTIGRFASSFVNGRAWLSKQGIADASTTGALSVSLGTFARASRVLHCYVALGTLVVMVLASLATYLDEQHSKDHDNLTYSAFVVFLLATTYAAFARWKSVLLTGLGEVAFVAQQTVVGTFAYLIITSAGLLMGGGLLALAAGLALQPFVTNLLLGRKLRRILSDHPSEGTLNTSPILAVLWPTSWRLGAVMLGSFLINTASTLIVSRNLSLEVTAQYGLSLQLLNILNMVAYMLVQTRMPAMVRLRAARQMEQLGGLFGRQLVAALSCFTLGIIVIVGFGQAALEGLGSRTHLLPLLPLSFLCVYKLLEFHHGAFALLVMSSNRVPFVLPSLVSGLAIVGLGVWWVQLWGIWGVMIATALVQAAFNNWWPVLKGLESIQQTYGRTVYLGIRGLATILR